MADQRKGGIGWTDETVNPIRRVGGGHYCVKISPGCKFCYSSRLQPRFGSPPFNEQGSDTAIELSVRVLRQVLAWKRPRRIFWCDMSDLFGEWVPDEMIDQCFAIMALTPQHTHQVLTKRVERMRQYLESSAREALVGAEMARFSHAPLIEWTGLPLSNVWLGGSVESQEQADARIPELLRTPASARFLSVEPLLAPVDLRRVNVSALRGHAGCMANVLDGVANPVFGIPFRHIDWVIVGGESSPNARPCEIRWIESLRDQCRVAGVPVFIKQLGAVPRWAGAQSTPAEPARGKCANPAEWPVSLRVQQSPATTSSRT